jgi:hypothetical protein
MGAAEVVIFAVAGLSLSDLRTTGRSHEDRIRRSCGVLTRETGAGDERERNHN